MASVVKYVLPSIVAQEEISDKHISQQKRRHDMEKKEKKEKKAWKLNIVDLLVLLIAAAAAVGVLLKVTGHLGGLGGNAPVGTNIVYTARVKNVDRDIYENIVGFIAQAKAQGKTGDQLMSNGELLPFYITNAVAEECDTYTMTTDERYLVTLESNAGKVDVLFTIEGYTEDNTITKVGSQEVRVGKPHTVKTTHFELYNGTTVSCTWENGTCVDQ